MRNKSIIAAVSAALLTTSVSLGQFQVDRSGATDANNRVGSGGRNITREQPKPWQLSNDIIYGNITGGKQFRGNSPSSDPRAFRGTTAGSGSDDFIRGSSGVSTGGMTSFNSQKTQVYYGDSRAVAPPSNFVSIPGSGGYSPPTPTPWKTTDPRQAPMSSDVTLSFRPDMFAMPGAIDAEYNPNAIIVPSIVQARQLNPGQLSDYTQINRNNAQQLSPEQLRLMQQQNTVPADDANTPAGKSDALNDAVRSGGLNDQFAGDQVKPNTVNTGAMDPNNSPDMGVRHMLVEPGQQSKVYSKLAEQSRLGGSAPAQPGDANQQAARDFNDAVRKRNEATKKPNDPDQPTPGVRDPGGQPGAQPGNVAPNVDPKKDDKVGATIPPKFDSLADDQKTELNAILKRAETQMAEGKFNSAIDTYEQAQKIAPNNPLIKLGRAHAELGGGYYRRAELSLRQTLSADKTLLSGQYNLRAFMGDDRLKVVEQDLRDLIQKNTNDAGPAVLQAYVYYNTANERRAATMLELAAQRSGGKDPFVTLLQTSWKLTEGTGPDLNK